MRLTDRQVAQIVLLVPLVLLAALVLAGCASDSLGTACGAPCWPEDWRGPRNVGECKPGRVSCDGAPRCEGWGAPTVDVCDGLDNDCDGIADEYLDTNQHRAHPCPLVGVCNHAIWDCANGVEVCLYPDTHEDNETRCDGLDNDCDGEVDEGPIGGACYSGPVGTERRPCAAGWLMCAHGESVCVGEILPEVEVCDGLDNDCDGEADDGLGQVQDVVIAVDLSGSMLTSGYFEAVRVAVDLAVARGAPSTRWGLVSFGFRSPWPYWRVEVPLGDAEAVRARLAQLHDPGDTEPTYDVINNACDGDARLEWRDEAARYLFVFADEMGQSRQSNDEVTAADACTDAGVAVTTWTESLWADDYDGIGEVRTLTLDPNALADQIGESIELGC